MTASEAPEVLDSRTESCSQPFVRRWYELESFTAWERGRIILQWRTELKRRGLPRTQYSDAAWCRLLGGRSSPQHVGRLRRVFERFGEVYESYPGLYWSHFYAALDWDDAELWLQGAVENRWTVQQMQQQRARTLQQPPPPTPQEPEVFAWSFPVFEQGAGNGASGSEFPPPAQGSAPVAGAESGTEPPAAQAGQAPARQAAPAEAPFSETEESAAEQVPESVAPAEQKPVSMGAATLPELPEDLIEPLEAFKLAVLHHKQTGWQTVSPAELLQAVEHLRQFVLTVSDRR